MVLPSVIEETEEPVQMHVGRTFQEVLLQRVLEIVDSFIRILQKVILEDCLVHVSISCESAFRSGPLLGASTAVIVTQSSTSSSYLNHLIFPSYDGGCLAVIGKLSVSSVWPDDLAILEQASMKPSPSDDIFPWISAENGGTYPRKELVPCGSRSRLCGPWIYSGESPLCQNG